MRGGAKTKNKEGFKMFNCLKLITAILLTFLTTWGNSFAATYTFSLTADSLGSPTAGVVAIDFIDGDGLSNSFATIDNLSSPASIYDGSFVESSPGTYSVDDTLFFSSLYIDLADVYAGFSFDVDVTLADPGLVGFPDSLVFSLLDEYYVPLFSTSDPTGADALAVMSFSGAETYLTGGFTVSIAENQSTPVPESGTIILFGLGLGCLVFFRRKNFRGIGLALVLLVMSSVPSHAAFEDVTSFVSIQRSPLVYSRATKTFNSVVTATNTSEHTINSPMFLVFTNVPETVSVNNAISLTAEGYPIVSLPVPPEGLTPGQTTENFVVKFHNPTRAQFTAGFVVMAGRDGLPPDPGAEGKITLQGVDSNGNGVRDDIEIYIELKYGDLLNLKEGLNQFAHTVQNGLTATTKEGSMQAADSQTRAIECLMYLDPESNAAAEIETQAVNTPERFNAWMVHQARLSGQVFPIRSMSEWRNSCEFDPDN